MNSGWDFHLAFQLALPHRLLSGLIICHQTDSLFCANKAFVQFTRVRLLLRLNSIHRFAWTSLTQPINQNLPILSTLSTLLLDPTRAFPGKGLFVRTSKFAMPSNISTTHEKQVLVIEKPKKCGRNMPSKKNYRYYHCKDYSFSFPIFNLDKLFLNLFGLLMEFAEIEPKLNWILVVD